ncbi:MAG: biotin transporter BioY [Lachnospiraceae bacterium]|nr:biotin transporter BioY [Lachnospiraceae bacterium]
MEKTGKQAVSTAEMAKIAVSAVIIAICAWITIPLGAVPFTLQTFGFFMVTLVLGWKNGLYAILLYLLMGAVGLPVFSGMKGGIGVLFGTTGGYLMAAAAIPLLYGGMTRLFGKKLWARGAGLLLGDLLVFIFGTIWFMIAYGAKNGAVSLSDALAWCVLPFIIPDLIKLAAALAAGPRIEKVTKV